MTKVIEQNKAQSIELISISYLANFFENYFGIPIRVERRVMETKIGFSLYFSYYFIRKSKPQVKIVSVYFEREPKDWFKWLDKNTKKLLKSLSI